MSIIKIVRAHQNATDSSDVHMLRLLCCFIDQQIDDGTFAPWVRGNLEQFIVDQLEQGPPCPDDPGMVNHFNDPRFTDADKDAIVQMVVEEIRDADLKDLAHEQIAGETLIELISYADPDPDLTSRILFNWGKELELDEIRMNEMCEDDNPETGECKSYQMSVDFARRMELLDDRGPTLLAKDYMERNL